MCARPSGDVQLVAYVTVRPGHTSTSDVLRQALRGTLPGHMVPAAFGTQTGGSVLRPAAFCGVVGYKPTFNLINRSGIKFAAESLDSLPHRGQSEPP